MIQLPRNIYHWLVCAQLIPNLGQLNPQDQVELPPPLRDSLSNGHLIAALLQHLLRKTSHQPSKALASVKNDGSRAVKSTNWNLIWLHLDTLDLTFDVRIKELILQGEHALIIQLLKQLYQADPQKEDQIPLQIKLKDKPKREGGLDLKALELSKDPQQAGSPLQFLMLLLKDALNMGLESILSLFTNQNKYLAHIIVKGVNDTFDPIILFYSLLNKHTAKLRSLLALNPKDAHACLYALKPGLLSKSQRVAELSIQLFSQLQDLYEWFVSAESKCLNTLFLGYTRHPHLRPLFWNLLHHIIAPNIAHFFTHEFPKFTQSSEEFISIATLLLKPLAEAAWNQVVLESGAVAQWLTLAAQLPEQDIDSQIIAFNFVAELMLWLPTQIEDNEQGLAILSRSWPARNLIQFSTLINELIGILERLGEEKSPLARRVYMEVSRIMRSLPRGEKKEYLLQNIVLTVSKFPTIPIENVIQHLKGEYVSSCEFLLICESIETTQNAVTLLEVGRLVGSVFCEQPLLNFYAVTLLKEIVGKLKSKEQKIDSFITSLFEQGLSRFAGLQKYKSSGVPQRGLCFGSSQSPKKVSKEEQQAYRVKLTQKQLYLSLLKYCVHFVGQAEDKQLSTACANLLIRTNSHIKQNNNKVPSKDLQSLLARFDISDQYVRQLEQSQLKLSVSSTLKQSTNQQHKSGNQQHKPINLQPKLTSQQQKLKRAQASYQSQKQAAELQKMKSNLQFELTNIYRNSHTECVLAEHDFLELFVQPHPQVDLLSRAELEARDEEVTEAILGKYRRLLELLFDNYSGVSYSGQNTGLIDDKAKRKEYLSSVELTKLLKDYKKFYLTSQQEVNSVVREIALRSPTRRSLHELDFPGFNQYIIHYCLNNLTLPHQITTTTTTTTHPTTARTAKAEIEKSLKTLEGQPIQVLLQEFFKQLKETFVSRKESIALFEDSDDLVLSKEQAEEVEALNQQLLTNPHYILPKGYKKVTTSLVVYSYSLSTRIIKIPEAYEVAVSVLDDILSASLLNFHILQSIAEKKAVSKARPATYTIKGQDTTRGQEKIKQRAMSTNVDKKHFLDTSQVQIISTSLRVALKRIDREDRKIAQEAALVLQSMLQKVSTIPQKAKTQRISAPKKKSISTAKILEIGQKNSMLKQKKSKQKQLAAEEAKKAKKEEEAKRRENIQKFLQSQKEKLIEKRRRQEEKRQSELEQEREKEQLKRENMQKFKHFHEEQYKKIKKIEEDALERIRREEADKVETKQREERERLKRSKKIKEETKLIIEVKKEAEKKLQQLFLSEPIKTLFQDYDQNLKALFQFLLNLTHKSLTQKNHNNQVVFETWRYFTNAFQLSTLFMSPQDVISIFKHFTKNKLVAKEFMAGLSFKEFEEALFRIAVKSKGYFNHISKKIKQPAQPQTNLEQEEREEKKQEREGNQFEQDEELDLSQLQQENAEGKTEIDQFGDLSKVNSGTIKGLIYYLKVPTSKAGQQERFKAILSKKPEYSPTQNRIKQKLSEVYDLSPQKKSEGASEKKSKLRSVVPARVSSQQE